MTSASDDSDEKPLDPAVERVQQRLRRLMLISGLTLGVGMIAVFAGVAYRVMTIEPGPPVAVAPGAALALGRSALGVAAEARLISTSLDGDRVALTFAEAAGETIVVVDVRSGIVVARLRVEAK